MAAGGMKRRSLAGGETRRIALFLTAGLINTAFGYGVYASAVWAGLAPSLAVVVSTIAGVAFNYRTLGAVFAARGLARLPHFVAAHMFLAPLNMAVLHLARAAGADPYLGEVAALFVATPASYLIMRWIVFPPDGRQAQLL